MSLTMGNWWVHDLEELYFNRFTIFKYIFSVNNWCKSLIIRYLDWGLITLSERTNKSRSDDRLTHWASHQMDKISPEVLVCQDMTEKIKCRRSRLLSKRFRNALPDCAKMENLKMMRAKEKRRWNWTKGGSLSGSTIPTYCAERSFSTHFLATINTFLNS